MWLEYEEERIQNNSLWKYYLESFSLDIWF